MTYHARFWAIKQNFVRSNSVLVKRIAKEMCNMRVFVHEMWAPVVMHKVHNAYGLHPDRQNTRFLRFFALFGAHTTVMYSTLQVKLLVTLQVKNRYK